MNSRYKYLIFDLDNTLYPKQSGLLQSIDRRIDDFIRQKLNLPPEDLTRLRQDYFHSYGTTLSGMVINHQINPDEYFNYTHHVNPADFIQPDPQLISMLRELNLVKVVFSNSPLEYVERVLLVLGIRPLIRKVYDIKFCNYLGKPNLSSYAKVLQDLKSDGSDCIMIDDMPANALGAKHSGMMPVLLSQTNVSGIDWVISDIYELKTVVNNIRQRQISA